MALKRKKGLVKGGSGGLLVSVVVHVGAFILAGALVVFTVQQKEEKRFDPPQPVERPKMKLKKPKVKIKKNAKPKSSSRIVAKIQNATLPDIQLPEMSGVGDGFAGGVDGELFEMPDLGNLSVFGGTSTIGSDFEGEVYSLLHDSRGGPIAMGPDQFRDVLRKYVLSGWKDSVLARYYCAPEKRYTTHFMIPPVPTAMAPGIFGVPELEDYYLFIKYEGKLVYPEDIKFRFWGVGDAFIFVHVDGKEVLLNTWSGHRAWFDWWQSRAGGDMTHLLGNQMMAVGDWIELKAGEPVDMKVLFGEWHGGSVSGMLVVEVEGEEYPTARTGGPLLPAFKTDEFSWETITEISRFLAKDECSLTNGPVFNDYHVATKTVKPRLVESLEESVEQAEPSPHVWTMKTGRTFEAEFVTAVGRNILLNTPKGRQMKIPRHRFSEEDLAYVELLQPPDLDLNFVKTTRTRKFGETYNAQALAIRGSFYTFGAEVKKTSMKPYSHPLTAEFFAIGDEIGAENHILLDRQKATFELTEENDYTFEFKGEPVELLDYNINEERRGQRYGGHLVVITDSRGEIIAYQTPSKNLFRKLDKLRQLRVGWYFNDDCEPCLPDPPRPWAQNQHNQL